MSRFLRGSFGSGLQLVLLALASSALSVALGLSALQASHGLLETPAAWWGMSQLGSAVVCLACGAGALGAAWHLLSAALALAVLPWGRDSSGHSHQAAARVLERWGAPLVRRIAAGALVAGMISAPAMAAELPASADDLGWQPTSSVSQETASSETAGESEGTLEAAEAKTADDAQPPADAVPTPEPEPEPSPAPRWPGTPQPPILEPGLPGFAVPERAMPEHGIPEDRLLKPASERSQAGSAAQPGSGQYIVAPSESLWSIAAKLLPEGSDDVAIARAWPELYRANAVAIGPSPALIKPGTALTIPPGLSDSPAPEGAQR